MGDLEHISASLDALLRPLLAEREQLAERAATLHAELAVIESDLHVLSKIEKLVREPSQNGHGAVNLTAKPKRKRAKTYARISEETRARVYAWMLNSTQDVTASQAQEMLGMSRATALGALNTLRDEGRIKRVGKDGLAYLWRVI